MNERSQPYGRRVQIAETDTMHDIISSKKYRKKYGTDDPREVYQKMFESSVQLQIERGEFEDNPRKEEIYRAFNARPKPKPKNPK